MRMVTEDFVKKMLDRSGIEIPEVCRRSFEGHFEGAINSEWYSKKQCYEVLFYQEGIEYIAEFGFDGDLIRYKVNIQKELLPGMILDILQEDREIMNVVLINEGNKVFYELIARSNTLQRYLLIFDQFGKIMEERIL